MTAQPYLLTSPAQYMLSSSGIVKFQQAKYWLFSSALTLTDDSEQNMIRNMIAQVLIKVLKHVYKLID